MWELTRGRYFQIWEYRVSHGSLLIRSPAGPDVDTSIDIICVGVKYIALPSVLDDIILSEPAETEIQQLEEVLQKRIAPPLRAWIFQTGARRFAVVGVALKVQEHYGDIFDSPFALPPLSS